MVLLREGTTRDGCTEFWEPLPLSLPLLGEAERAGGTRNLLKTPLRWHAVVNRHGKEHARSSGEESERCRFVVPIVGPLPLSIGVEVVFLSVCGPGSTPSVSFSKTRQQSVIPNGFGVLLQSSSSRAFCKRCAYPCLPNYPKKTLDAF